MMVREEKGKLGCLRAAVINAVSCLKGSVMGRKIQKILKQDPTHYTEVGQIGFVLHDMNAKISIQGPRKQERKLMRQDGSQWVVSLKQGVWLVRFCGRG